VAGQVDGGDGRREADGAVRAHAPHDGGRSRAVNGQARYFPEAVLGKVTVFRIDMVLHVWVGFQSSFMFLYETLACCFHQVSI